MTASLQGAPADVSDATRFDPDIVLRGERPADDAGIAALNDAAFGPGRYARTAYRIRERGGHDPRVSFVAVAGETLVASVRMSPIAIGGTAAWLLGPLAVAPERARRGIGRALVRRALGAADAAGGDPVLLVGDLAYYGPCGFRRADPASVRLPGPVEPGRLLLRIAPGAAGHAGPAGAVRAAPERLA